MNATIDESIARVERLYTTITGRRPPQQHGMAPIPPERDPFVHVEEQLERLVSAIEQLVPIDARMKRAPRAIQLRMSPEPRSVQLDRGVLTIRFADEGFVPVTTGQ